MDNLIRLPGQVNQMIKHCSCEITFSNGFNTKTYEDEDLQRQVNTKMKL